MTAPSDRTCDAEFLYPGGVFTAKCQRPYGHRHEHEAPGYQPAMDPPTDFRVTWENIA